MRHKFPPRLPGNSNRAVWLNRLLDGARSSVALSSPNTFYFETPNGTFRRTVRAPGGGAKPELFVIASAEDDHLVCHTWDGSTEGETDVLVAKHKELRISLKSETKADGLHGYTYGTGLDDNNPERYDAFGGSIETQVVIPEWMPGREIYAMKAVTTVEVDGVAVGYIYVGPSRQWAKKYEAKTEYFSTEQ